MTFRQVTQVADKADTIVDDCEIQSEIPHMKLQVDAPQSEVTHVLSLALTAEEMQELSIHSSDAASDPLLSEPRRLDPLTWISMAAASGVIGNTTFALLKKAAEVLIAKYGPNHVRETPDDSKSV